MVRRLNRGPKTDIRFHPIGAGYMKSYKGDTLQVHTDFNWVEELALNEQ